MGQWRHNCGLEKEAAIRSLGSVEEVAGAEFGFSGGGVTERVDGYGLFDDVGGAQLSSPIGNRQGRSDPPESDIRLFDPLENTIGYGAVA